MSTKPHGRLQCACLYRWQTCTLLVPIVYLARQQGCEPWSVNWVVVLIQCSKKRTLGLMGTSRIGHPDYAYFLTDKLILVAGGGIDQAR